MCINNEYFVTIKMKKKGFFFNCIENEFQYKNKMTVMTSITITNICTIHKEQYRVDMLYI